MSFTEYTTVEKEIIDSLCGVDLRWRYLPGDRVTAEYRGGDEQEMLLILLLRAQLKKLNPGFITSDERADLVITRLRTIRDNQEWHSWLRGEETMSFVFGENARNIKLIDFENPDANDYLCTNQVWIQGVEHRRPDI